MREGRTPGGQAGGSRRGTGQSQRQQQSSRRVVFSQSGKVVGTIAGQVLRKSVDASRHFLRTPPAIAWDLSALEQARQNGTTHCEVRDRESGRLYIARLESFFAKGFRVERGYGQQLGLPLNQWEVREPGRPPVVQLSLFGDAA